MVPPDAQSEATEHAWAAGFFDGEGCTTLYRKNGNVAVRLTVAQKDMRPLLRFHHAVGGLGRIFPVTGRQLNRWNAGAEAEARAVLRMLWPYLSEPKREQAERCSAQSTWHNGHLDAMLCRDLTHDHRPRPSGGRRCVTCEAAYNKAYKARKLLSRIARAPAPRPRKRVTIGRLEVAGLVRERGDGLVEITDAGIAELGTPLQRGALFAVHGRTPR